MFSTTAHSVLSEFQPLGILVEYVGDLNKVIEGVAAVENCGVADLVFVDKKDYLEIIADRKPAAVVTSAALKAAVVALNGPGVFVSQNVALAHALIKQKYGDRDYAFSGWVGVHASAVIHDSAQISDGAVIEPRVVIGKNVKIGRRARIMAGVIIENDAQIGDDTIVHPNAVIGYGCILGNHVNVASGAVIGSEGYGFAQDAKRKSHPIPQTGIVVVEDRVRIGANTCIDRAAYQETRIGAGTKLDNLCHIAHNVQIGEDCLLTSMFCIAGSSQIGDRVIASGQTGVLDHVRVCSDTVLLQRAGVNKDIETPGAYAGAPHQPLGDYMKNAAVLRSAVELRKRISELEKNQK